MPTSLRRQNGAMLITSALWLITLLGFTALAFDIGHLLLVRNELQNDADAAALAGANCLNKTTAASGADCTSTPSSTLNWSMASTKANISIGLNKSDSIRLSNGTVQTGYWDINGGTALKDTTLSPIGPCTITAGVMGPCDKPAVMVTISRASGSNGGPVGTLIATMFGGSAVPISAKAVAVISSPGSVLPSALIPQAINKCMFDLYWDSVSNSPKLATTATLNGVPQVIGQPWEIRIGSSYHYPDCDSGQWTSFQIDDNSTNYVNGLINNGNPTPLDIGDSTYIQPGTKTALYNTLSSKYPTPPGADIFLPVIDSPTINSSTTTSQPIIAFAGFHISDIRGGSDKYIQGHFTSGKTTSGSSGIGPYYGSYTPARLAN